MKKIFQAAVAATLFAAAPAMAQVAVADLEAAVGQAAAYQAAQGQIKSVYQKQIDAFNARQQSLQTQLQPLQTEIENLQKNPATPKATLEAKYNAFRTQQQNGAQELQTLAAPFSRPNAYAQAQVAEKLSDAVKAAMNAKGIKIILNYQPQIVTYSTQDADLTPEIVNQLNTLVKTVSITPPASWQPGQPTTAAPAGR